MYRRGNHHGRPLQRSQRDERDASLPQQTGAGRSHRPPPLVKNSKMKRQRVSTTSGGRLPHSGPDDDNMARNRRTSGSSIQPHGRNASLGIPSSAATAKQDNGKSMEPSGAISTIVRLENFLLEVVIDPLASDRPEEIPMVPMIDAEHRKLSLANIHQCRNLTSILLVATYCHRLLLSGRTTTIREVFYYLVTHFRGQRECEKAILDLTILLELPSRLFLALIASPKGWFCGCITLYDEATGEIVLDGTALDLHGASITPTTYGDSSKILIADEEWILGLRSGQGLGGSQSRRLRAASDAKCILVTEKEGVYIRLSEDRIFDKIPCILVTGKGECECSATPSQSSQKALLCF